MTQHNPGSLLSRALLVVLVGLVCLTTDVRPTGVEAAERGKVAVARSPHAKLRPVTMNEASWTEGFWADRFRRCRAATIPAVEEGLLRRDNSEQLDVLLIAAGLKLGERKGTGTNWTDGDCHKWIEAMARHHAAFRLFLSSTPRGP